MLVACLPRGQRRARRGRSGSSSWRPWLLSLAMDLAASRLVASGAELSQQAARVAAVHPALRGASAAELCLLQVRPRPVVVLVMTSDGRA